MLLGAGNISNSMDDAIGCRHAACCILYFTPYAHFLESHIATVVELAALLASLSDSGLLLRQALFV